MNMHHGSQSEDGERGWPPDNPGARARLLRAVEAYRELTEPERQIFVSELIARFRAGMPGAPFDGVLDEAMLWADYASPEEHEAYAVACFKSLPPGRQRDFVAWAARSKVGSAA